MLPRTILAILAGILSVLLIALVVVAHAAPTCCGPATAVVAGPGPGPHGGGGPMPFNRPGPMPGPHGGGGPMPFNRPGPMPGPHGGGGPMPFNRPGPMPGPHGGGGPMPFNRPGPMPGPHGGGGPMPFNRPGPQPFQGGGDFHGGYFNPMPFITPPVVNYDTAPRYVMDPSTGQAVLVGPGQWTQPAPGQWVWQSLPFWPLLGAAAPKSASTAPEADMPKRVRKIFGKLIHRRKNAGRLRKLIEKKPLRTLIGKLTPKK